MTEREQNKILDVFNYANRSAEDDKDEILGAYNYGIVRGIKETLQSLGYVVVVGNDGRAEKIIKPEEKQDKA